MPKGPPRPVRRIHRGELMKTWEYTTTSARRTDGLVVAVRQGIRRNRLSVGFADTHALTMNEWRALWMTFVPYPPWDEEQMARSMRGLNRPHFLFEPNEPWERLVEQIDRLIAPRAATPEGEPPADEQSSVLNELRAIAQRVQALIERLESNP